MVRCAYAFTKQDCMAILFATSVQWSDVSHEEDDGRAQGRRRRVEGGPEWKLRARHIGDGVTKCAGATERASSAGAAGASFHTRRESR